MSNLASTSANAVVKVPKNAIVYLRVSSKGQDAPEHGRFGLETQNHAILEYCQQQGIMVMGTYTEVGTAAKPDAPRKGLTAAIAALRPGYVLLVHTVSRFSRCMETTTGFLNQVYAKEGVVYSVGEGIWSVTPQFWAAVQMADAQSREYSAKMKASVARRRAQGHWIGQAPYGKRAVRNEQNIRVLEDNPDEQDVLEAIYVCLHERLWSFAQTATFLNDEARNEPQYLNRGRCWTISLVRSAEKELNSTKYADYTDLIDDDSDYSNDADSVTDALDDMEL